MRPTRPGQKETRVSHRNAPLTPAGRLRLVRRCEHRPIAHVAAEAGISRQCLSKWVNRYRTGGEAGLLDRACVPHHQPATLDPALVAKIERLRRERKWSARRIAGELATDGHQVSVSTVGRWLVRLGINRRRFLDPNGADNRKPANTIVARYPGHMVHVDIKKVGRIPDGGGWRVHGRGSDHAKTVDRGKKRGTRTGYVYLHSIVDGFSRLAYTEALPDEKGCHCSRFHQPRQGVLRRPRHHPVHQGGHRQRCLLPLDGIRPHPHRDAAPVHPALHPTAQREGRALQPDPRRGVPLRPRMDQ